MNKGYFYLLILLVVITLCQGVQVYFLRNKVNNVYQNQYEQIEVLKERNLLFVDSIKSLKDNKIKYVVKKKNNLKTSLNKSNKNNIRYEQLKKQAINNSSTDSLQSFFSKRYK